MSDLKSDNFVVVASTLVVTSKLIGPDLVNAGGTQQLCDVGVWVWVSAVCCLNVLSLWLVRMVCPLHVRWLL
jgi:hypothetical protein